MGVTQGATTAGGGNSSAPPLNKVAFLQRSDRARLMATFHFASIQLWCIPA